VLGQLLNSPRKRLVALVLGLAVIGVGAAVALSGGEGDVEVAAPTTTTTAPTTTTSAPGAGPLAPLTGLPGNYGKRLERPALVVKIDNDNNKARPQVGLNEADIVYEERVEGSVTRLLAVFHSRDSVPVGPVRSARTSDIAIVSALRHPYFAWSGANPTFAQRIRAADLMDVGYDTLTSEYFREPSRRAPSNLMLKNTSTIKGIPNEGGSPPPPLFAFRTGDQPVPNLTPAEGARVTFGGSAGAAPTEWRWNGKGWARSQAGTPHVDAAGVQVAPANVVIQFVNYAPTDVADQFGVRIPEAQMLGTGEVWVLTGGGSQPHGVVKGKWWKPHLGSVTRYLNEDGTQMRLTRGTTWVVLPNPGGATLL
jgi:hypothetical protein